MSLSEKILQLRTGLGLSQEELAARLDVSRQSVSKWETGQSVPDLEKLIKLADLFGITVDELVREGERPRPPEPSQPQVVYIKEKRSLTGTQTAGVCLELMGLALDLLGLVGEQNLLVVIGTVFIVLGLPLLLAKKHPWIIFGWLAVGLSLVFFNPYTSVAPWGLLGGLRRLYQYITLPGVLGPAYLFAIPLGIGRGLVSLLLIFLTFRAWKNRKKQGTGR